MARGRLSAYLGHPGGRDPESAPWTCKLIRFYALWVSHRVLLGNRQATPKQRQRYALWVICRPATLATMVSTANLAGLIPSPLRKRSGVEMTKTNRSLGVLAASAAGVLAAVGMLLLTMLLLGGKPAEAAFPGQNGKIAFQ